MFIVQIPHASSIPSLVLPHFALGMGKFFFRSHETDFVKKKYNNRWHFLFPGIGTLDVALVPLLATIVDSKYMYDDELASTSSFGSSYGGIYAIQQIRLAFISKLLPSVHFHFQMTHSSGVKFNRFVSYFRSLQLFSVSLAYFLGPLLGGEISQFIGFSWLMSLIGLANICYGIYLMRTVLCLFQPEASIKKQKTKNTPVVKIIYIFFHTGLQR